MEAVCRRRHCCCNFLSARSPSVRPSVRLSRQSIHQIRLRGHSIYHALPGRPPLPLLFARLYAYLVPAAAAPALVSPRNSALSPICQRARAVAAQCKRGGGPLAWASYRKREWGKQAAAAAEKRAKRREALSHICKSRLRLAAATCVILRRSCQFQYRASRQANTHLLDGASEFRNGGSII